MDDLLENYEKLLAFIHETANYHHDCYALKCFPCEAEQLLKEIGEDK